MNNELNIFEKFLFEAPDDGNVPPDMVNVSSPPPEVPSGAENDGPPEMSEDMADDGPPEMDDFGEDDFSDEENMDDESNEENQQQNLGLDGKVSAIMNMNLYQRFLSLLNTIGGQLNMIKSNSDILHSLSSDSLDIVESLNKLDENIRLYLKNSFINENYSKNLLFFNKCLNLLKLLNEVFDSNIKKGIKTIE